FTSEKKETVNEEELKGMLDSAVLVVHAAAGVGKTAVALSMLRDELGQFAQRAMGIPSIVNALRSRFATVGRITVGQLRSSKGLADAVGFIDDGTRPDDEAFVIQK